MKQLLYPLLLILCSGLFLFCGGREDTPEAPPFQLESIEIDGKVNAPPYADVNPVLVVKLSFSDAVNATTVPLNMVMPTSVDGRPWAWVSELSVQ